MEHPTTHQTESHDSSSPNSWSYDSSSQDSSDRGTAGHATGDGGSPTLGDWVRLRRIPDVGAGRTPWLLVNDRDGGCLSLTDDEAEELRMLVGLEPEEPAATGFAPPTTQKATSPGPPSEPHEDRLRSLRGELADGGFLAQTSGSVDPPRTGWRHTVRELEIRSTSADRVTRAAYRVLEPVAFGRAGLVAQAVLAVAGLVSLVLLLLRGTRASIVVDAAQVPIVLAVSLASVTVHELAHALVVVRAAGRVDAAGMRLLLGTPSFFVEAVDAQLLTRRQRVIQAAAGTWAEWLVTSVAAIWLVAGAPSLIGPALLARFVLLNTLTVLSNLLPFVRLDGSWLLADAVRMPDLSNQANGAVRRLVVAAVLRRPVSRSERWLAVYSAVNAVVAVGLLGLSAVVWCGAFSQVIVLLLSGGVVGVVVLVAAATVLSRPALVALVPRAVSAADGTRELWRAVRFRAQFRWRVAAVEALRRSHRLPESLNEEELGVLAGRLELVSDAASRPDSLLVSFVDPRTRRYLVARAEYADLPAGTLLAVA